MARIGEGESEDTDIQQGIAASRWSYVFAVKGLGEQNMRRLTRRTAHGLLNVRLAQ